MTDSLSVTHEELAKRCRESIKGFADTETGKRQQLAALLLDLFDEDPQVREYLISAWLQSYVMNVTDRVTLYLTALGIEHD